MAVDVGESIQLVESSFGLHDSRKDEIECILLLLRQTLST